MSRSFPGDATGRLIASAPITSAPLSMGCWGYTATGFSQYAIELSDSAAFSDQQYQLFVNSDNTVRIHAPGVSDAVTSTTISADTWFHMMATIDTSMRKVYLNGGGTGTSTGSSSPSGIANLVLGADRVFFGFGDPAYFNGWKKNLAEAAIWDIVLSDEEVAILASGISPLLVRPDHLVSYWPLIGCQDPEIDAFGAASLSVNGSGMGAAAHSRIFQAW
jgi:Concanavalin A-like lectin/glucanases superfamily